MNEFFMKRKYQAVEGRFARLARHPGIIQITLGLFILLPILFASFISERYQKCVELEIKKSRETESFILKPPSLVFFRFFLDPAYGANPKIIKPDGDKQFPPPVDENMDEKEPGIHTIHYFGTDHKGKDILVNIMIGARTAIWGSALAITIALLIGIPLGVMAGYLGGWIEKSVGYLTTILTTLPKLIVLIIVASIYNYTSITIMVAIGVLASPKIMDIIQTRIQLLKESQFIEAAKEMGVPGHIIIIKHILWHNCNTLIFIQLAYEFAEVILLEASLSYIGFGPKNVPTWGSMVDQGFRTIDHEVNGQPFEQYWSFFFPCLFIVLSISASIMLADGLKKWFSNRVID